MLNSHQRDTLEKMSVNLFTGLAGSLVIGGLLTPKAFRGTPFILGLLLSILCLWYALWINRKRRDE